MSSGFQNSSGARCATNAMSSRDFFKNKRIAVIGIGPHGEMINDIKFLIKAGGIVSVYDMRSEARLKSHIESLRLAGLLSSMCGSIPPDDLLDMDLIILSHEYSRESSFLKLAREKKVQIEYPETLFFRLAPSITLIGIMGEYGKSTVMSMLMPMLETITEDESQGVYALDPESSEGILAYCKKLKSGDVIVIRIIESMMKELNALRMSPHVAVFTSVPPAGSYTQSPFELVAYQTYNNFIVASNEVIDATHALGFQPKAKMLRTKASQVPTDWEFAAAGSHDRDNASLAIQVAQLFKVSDETIRDVLEKWKPLRGRLELVKKLKQVEFYNDTASVSAASTQLALTTLAGKKVAATEEKEGSDKRIILILGGVDRGHDYRALRTVIPKHVRTLILLPGSGTMKERKEFSSIEDVEVISSPSVEEAVVTAFGQARKGQSRGGKNSEKEYTDRVLFSPGFAAGGVDQSRKERGERFVRAVRLLK